MNREILFRGKSSDNDEWVEGYLHKNRNPFEKNYYIDTLKTDKIKIGKIDDFTVLKCVTEMVEPETIGQYTGLKDKNGNKIFEGDILQNKTNEYYKGNVIVIYNNKQARFEVDTSIKCCHKDLPTMLSRDFEVVGNIYDNPELLEGK